MGSESGHSQYVASRTTGSQDTSKQMLHVSDNRMHTNVQRKEMHSVVNSPRTVAQRQVFSEAFQNGNQNTVSNNTGMPDALKTGLENMSGVDLSDIKVHYNSSKPSHLQALAYAQGNEIHLGPGQEKHLPHEGWHLVQQRQGRVKPTLQMKGIAINDNNGLEKEADKMGKAASHAAGKAGNHDVSKNVDLKSSTVQLKPGLTKGMKVFVTGGREGTIDEVTSQGKSYKVLIDTKIEELAEAEVTDVRPSATPLGTGAADKKEVSSPAVSSTTESKDVDTSTKFFFKDPRTSKSTASEPAAPFQLATIQFGGDYDIEAYKGEITSYADKCARSNKIPVIEFRLYDAMFGRAVVEKYAAQAREKLTASIKVNFNIIFSLLRNELTAPKHLTEQDSKDAGDAMEYLKNLLASMEDIDMDAWGKPEWKKLFTQAPSGTDKGIKLAGLSMPAKKMIEGDMMVPVEEALTYVEKLPDSKEKDLSLHQNMFILLLAKEGNAQKIKKADKISKSVRRNSDVIPDTLTLTNLVTGEDKETLTNTLKACEVAFLKRSSQVYLIIEGMATDLTTRAGSQMAALTKAGYSVEVIQTEFGSLFAQQSGVNLKEPRKTPPARVKIRVTKGSGQGSAAGSGGKGTATTESKESIPKGTSSTPAAATNAAATPVIVVSADSTISVSKVGDESASPESSGVTTGSAESKASISNEALTGSIAGASGSAASRSGDSSVKYKRRENPWISYKYNHDIRKPGQKEDDDDE